jgi:hypothetical protein
MMPRIVERMRLSLYVSWDQLPPTGALPELPAGMVLEYHSSLAAVPSDLPGVDTHREIFEKRFEEGHSLCIARDGRATAHAIWIARNKLQVDEIQWQLHFLESSCCMYDAQTPIPYRRRGIYSAVLSRIAGSWLREGGRRVYIYTRRDNPASVRGIEKSGMLPVGDISCLRLGGALCLFRRFPFSEPL